MVLVVFRLFPFRNRFPKLDGRAASANVRNPTASVSSANVQSRAGSVSVYLRRSRLRPAGGRLRSEIRWSEPGGRIRTVVRGLTRRSSVNQFFFNFILGRKAFEKSRDGESPVAPRSQTWFFGERWSIPNLDQLYFIV